MNHEPPKLQPGRLFRRRLNPTDVDYFGLPIYEHFDGKPFHVFKAHQRWDVPKVWEDHRSKVIRSRQGVDPCATDQAHVRVGHLVLQLADDVYCRVDHSTLEVYAPTFETAREYGLPFLERYAKPAPKEAPQFHLLSFCKDVVEIQEVQVVKPLVLSDEDLQLHYGTDAPDFERYLLRAWDFQVASQSSFDPPFNSTLPSRYLIKRASPHDAINSPSSLNGGKNFNFMGGL
jgi:hypothetical protein